MDQAASKVTGSLVAEGLSVDPPAKDSTGNFFFLYNRWPPTFSWACHLVECK